MFSSIRFKVFCFLQNSFCLIDLKFETTLFLFTLGLSYKGFSTASKLR